jgi:hypothetical protein
MKRKSKSQTWFKKVRGSYLPNSWQGWLLYVPYAVYVIGVVFYAYLSGWSLGTALFVIVPNWVAALAAMTWIAERTSH